MDFEEIDAKRDSAAETIGEPLADALITLCKGKVNGNTFIERSEATEDEVMDFITSQVMDMAQRNEGKAPSALDVAEALSTAFGTAYHLAELDMHKRQMDSLPEA